MADDTFFHVVAHYPEFSIPCVKLLKRTKSHITHHLVLPNESLLKTLKMGEMHCENTTETRPCLILQHLYDSLIDPDILQFFFQVKNSAIFLFLLRNICCG